MLFLNRTFQNQTINTISVVKHNPQDSASPHGRATWPLPQGAQQIHWPQAEMTVKVNAEKSKEQESLKDVPQGPGARKQPFAHAQ